MFKHSELASELVSELPAMAAEACARSELLPPDDSSLSAVAAPDNTRWLRVKQRLRAELGEDIFSSWFARMDLDAMEGAVVRMSVPTRFLKSWILAHYAERVLACWKAEAPAVQRIDLVLRSAVIRGPANKPKCANGTGAIAELRGMPPAATASPTPLPSGGSERSDGSPLDPRLTFETFLVGRSNTLAHAAARQVATARRGDPVMFNPLYIHSGVGLGKTHLLQAIAWAGGTRERRILYLTAERFMYGFVSALRNQTALAFKEALRGIDVLVIDDLQFLQGKQTQAEFCHTLNALVDSGRQVVVAADRPPSDLESLDDRVRSRLAGGLVVEIGALGEELRLEILKSRVANARSHHPGFDVPPPVLAFVAKTVTHNGRDLDGALNRLLAHNKLTGQPVTLEMAELAVRDLIRPQEPKRIKIEDIQRTVARHFNVSRADMLSSRRTANVVRPRQIAMYLAKTLTLRSLPEIGRRFGGRDHTTVLHAVRKIEGLVDKDQVLAEELEVLKRMLLE
ncbi:MAG TPA: chromosomal replication initiator protein DnaA [Xanthobacteraceae bacterium]|nr:chromosomal replication initiator protein DnaA [Xanthobacteraceae bacterium]